MLIENDHFNFYKNNLTYQFSYLYSILFQIIMQKLIDTSSNFISFDNFYP